LNLWLLGASVLLASNDSDDENHGASRRLLLWNEPLASLDLAFYEVADVAVRSWQDPSAARRFLERLDALGDDGGIIRADTALLTDASALAHD
jgi:hypothetical protein